MKKLLILLILVLTGVSMACAENQNYVVSNKKGKARFIQVESEDGKWKYVRNVPDVYLENGVEISVFEIEADKSLNYKGTPYIYRKSMIFEYDGKYLKVIDPEKDIKPVNEKGETTSGLGIRNYLSNTALGRFYLTAVPGLIALACVFISGLFLIIGFFKESVPAFIRWAFAVPLCVIAVLEIGAAFSLGTDAAWWVNPDDVGYWIATPLLIPYSLVAAMMIFSYKLYGFLGTLDGWANVIISILLIIGIILTVISAIFVVINFLFALFVIVFAGWMFGGISHKDNNGNIINSGPLGTYRTDRNGNTTHIGN